MSISSKLIVQQQRRGPREWLALYERRQDRVHQPKWRLNEKNYGQ